MLAERIINYRIPQYLLTGLLIFFMLFITAIFSGNDSLANTLIGNNFPVSSAVNNQERPSVASDGTNYLVVWEDNRSGISSDIYCKFITTGGVAGTKFPISISNFDKLRPNVFFNGINYLVTWMDYRSGASDIYGQIVSSSGTLVGSEIPISTAPGYQIRPNIAFDGTSYFLVWWDNRNGNFDIYGQFVSTLGALVGPDIAISTGAGNQQRAEAAFDGTNYFVTWEDDRNGDFDVYGRFVSTSGVFQGSEIFLVSAVNDQVKPRISFDGSNYIIVWGDKRSGIQHDIYAKFITTAGLQIGNKFLVSSAPGEKMPGRVIFNGTDRYLVVWDTCSGSPCDDASSSGDIRGQFITTSGLLDGLEISISNEINNQHRPRLAFDGSNYLAVWTDFRNSIDYDIYGQFIQGSAATPNQTPVANAGGDQTMHIGTLVTLDGSSSYDPDANYPLSYSWIISGIPTGSTATLTNPNSINPTFIPDILGNYYLTLTVTDSLSAMSIPDNVIISTINSAPVADAGQDQVVIQIMTNIQLDGNQSYDPDGDNIIYSWNMIAKPAESSAILVNQASPNPVFMADVHGDYEASLVVTDEYGAVSSSDSVMISFQNVNPVADAGTNQSVMVVDTVYLDGSSSSDANLDNLNYSWNIISTPQGSQANLNNPVSPMTSFVADLPGTYVISLVVNDGFTNSDPSNVTIVAVSREDVLIQTLHNLMGIINTLDPSVFKNKNMKKTLTKKINSAIEEIDKTEYNEAVDKLEDDVLEKTNGCAESGSPDKNDWARTCSAQEQIYPMVIYAIDLLNSIIGM